MPFVYVQMVIIFSFIVTRFFFGGFFSLFYAKKFLMVDYSMKLNPVREASMFFPCVCFVSMCVTIASSFSTSFTHRHLLFVISAFIFSTTPFSSCLCVMCVGIFSAIGIYGWWTGGGVDNTPLWMDGWHR